MEDTELSELKQFKGKERTFAKIPPEVLANVFCIPAQQASDLIKESTATGNLVTIAKNLVSGNVGQNKTPDKS